MMDQLKRVWFRVKIFLWYLVTEPFRELVSFWFHVEKAFNKTYYLALYFLVLATAATFWGKRHIAGLFLIFLLALLLMNEWRSGRFISRYRSRTRAKAKEGQDD